MITLGVGNQEGVLVDIRQQHVRTVKKNMVPMREPYIKRGIEIILYQTILSQTPPEK